MAIDPRIRLMYFLLINKDFSTLHNHMFGIMRDQEAWDTLKRLGASDKINFSNFETAAHDIAKTLLIELIEEKEDKSHEVG